jgi:adenosine deaminase
MNENYLGVARALDLSREQLAELAKNGFRASWLPEGEKNKNIQKIELYLEGNR